MQSVIMEVAPPAAVAEAAGAAAGVAVAALLFAAVQLILAAGLYVWTALALAAVFRKVDRPAARAWIPVLNLWTLFEVAGMKGWWALVLIGGGLLTTVLASVTNALFIASAQNAAFGGSGGDAAGALLGATLVPIVLLLMFLAGAVILLIRMMGPLNRGFERGAGFVLLGVILLPVWASLIGWGSARWRGLARGGLPPTPFAQEPQPAASASSVPADTTAFAPPATAPFPAAAPVAAWSPPPLGPSPAAAPPAAPAVPAVAPAAPASALPPTTGEVEEHTVLAAHRRPSASLRLPDGQTIALPSDLVVLGRNPSPPADAAGAHPVAVDDATRTVSKTHALLRRGPEGWTVTDLSSTNGVIVGDGDTEIAVGTAVAVSGRFLLGDAELFLDTGAR
ncbi:FHA domain-containing protein [Microbacterium sp. NPDC077663]|uniref:FHA domain-containing protein n=1 Tax=Microbacterium sp. NPDC077663 TaxID=3364189 RepID=UPI0037CA37BF